MSPAGKKPLHHHLYVQVLVAIALGALFGWLAPGLAAQPWVKALGDGFIKLIKMVIAPIVFCTVVSGVAHVEDARKVGRVGVKALVYFEIVSTFALLLGLIVGNLVPVGRGLTGKPDAAAVAVTAPNSSTSSASAIFPLRTSNSTLAAVNCFEVDAM